VSPRKRPSDAPTFFATAARFRAWLAQNADTASVLNVGFYKVDSGRASLTWPESVDEALCYGWIDGVRRRIDDDAYQIRFSPRKKASVWSAINIARAKALIADGRMRPQGVRAFEQRIERKSKVYSYEQDRAPTLTETELRRFGRNKPAWTWFEGQAPSRRRAMLHWITSAKQPQTRARRLDKLIESAACGVRLMP
jgi:uncharacterized protein YdeI (YjbR/CyaY-like superfamily)